MSFLHLFRSAIIATFLLFALLPSTANCQAESAVTDIGNIVIEDSKGMNHIFLLRLSSEGNIEACISSDTSEPKLDCKVSNVYAKGSLESYVFVAIVKGLLTTFALPDVDLASSELERQISGVYEDFKTRRQILNELGEDQTAARFQLNGEVILWRKNLSWAEIKKCQENCNELKHNKDKRECKKRCTAKRYERTRDTLTIVSGRFYIRRGYMNSFEITGFLKNADAEVRLVVTNPYFNLSLFPKPGKDIFLPAVTTNFREDSLYIKPLESFELVQLDKASRHFKDKSFELSAGESVYLDRMNINDYLGIHVGSDALGLNLNNSSGSLKNSFILNYPVNMRGRSRWRLIPFMQTDLNYYLINGEGGSGYKELEVANDSVLFVDFFDYIRYQNLGINQEMSLLAMESKGSNFILNLTIGQKFYRSGFSYTRIDTINGEAKTTNFNEASTAWYAKLLAQYRPSSSLGADISLSANVFQRYKLNNENPRFDIVRSQEVDSSGNTRTFSADRFKHRIFYTFDLHAYAQTGNRGGVFAQISADFSFRSNNSGVYPSVLIGYSSNLNAYVSSSKKQ